MNTHRLCVPALVLLSLAIQPRSAAWALDVTHNTNASTATSGLPTASDEQNGDTPKGHVIRLTTLHTAADVHGRWAPGSIVSGASLGLRSTASTSASGQGADQIFLQAHDLVFSSSDPLATQAVMQMHVQVTWRIQLPPINCGDVNDCNIAFVANTGAGAFIDGQLGSAGCLHSFCGQPASGSADFVTPAVTVDLNSPFSPSFRASTSSRVQLCAGDFMSNADAEISLSFPDPVFVLPPGVTANSPDLGIVDNHWTGATGCASILSNPANASVPEGNPASFSVLGSGPDTLSFKWYHDGIALTDGGTISGSTMSTLSISSAAASDSGLYSVSVENGCAPDTSTSARLTVGSTAGVARGDDGSLTLARLIYQGPQPSGGHMTFTLHMPRPGGAALEILDVDGHLVSMTEQRSFPAGNSVITWDGRSSAGARAPSGVYFVRLVADGKGADSHKVVLVR